MEKTTLRQKLSHHWFCVQGVLFPHLEETYGPLTKHHQLLVSVLDFIRIERHVHYNYTCVGRPLDDRHAIFRAFIAKAVFNIATTVLLRERLLSDPTLRRMCGFQGKWDIPSASTFSRAFAEFSKTALPDRVHEALIDLHQKERLVGHTSYDSTAIDARECVDPVRKIEMKQNAADEKQKKKNANSKMKRGRPKKGTPPKEKEATRLERQQTMTFSEMIHDLPKVCDIGRKQNSKGLYTQWKGYKLHLATADGGIPLAAIVTAASLHDSQAALPLMHLVNNRVTHLYDVMDSAYDATIIRQTSQTNGCVPLIDFNCRTSNDTRAFAPHEAERYKERSVAERMNARLKDEFGARSIYVRGDAKIKAHLMMGVLALTVDQLLRLIQ